MSKPTRRQIMHIGAGVAVLPACTLASGNSFQDKTKKTENDKAEKKDSAGKLSITPFLMFTGKAEEAMNLYMGLFDNSKIVEIEKYGVNQDGPEGSIKVATFSLNGQNIMCIDSPIKHAFTFTPATSLFVACSDADKITNYFNVLSKGGEVMMPLGEYPFSKKFAWVADRFGVSWQMTLT